MLAEGAGAVGPPLADGGVLKPTAENVPQFLELEFLCRGADTKASRTEPRLGSSLRFYLGFLRCEREASDCFGGIRKIKKREK